MNTEFSFNGLISLPGQFVEVELRDFVTFSICLYKTVHVNVSARKPSTLKGQVHGTAHVH